MEVFSREELQQLIKILTSLYKIKIIPFIERIIIELKKKKGEILIFLDPGARALSYSLEPLFKKYNFYPKIFYFCASKRLLGGDLNDWKGWAIINNLKVKKKKVAIIDDVTETGETINMTQKLLEELGGKVILKTSLCCLGKRKLKNITCQYRKNILAKKIKFGKKRWKVNILSIIPIKEMEYFFLPGVGSCISKGFPTQFKAGKVINIYSLFKLKQTFSEIHKNLFKNENWTTELSQKILKRIFKKRSNLAQNELENLGEYFLPYNLVKMRITYTLPQFRPLSKKIKKYIKEIYQQK